MRGKKAKELRRLARAIGQPSQLMVRKHIESRVNQEGKNEQHLKAYQFFWRGFRRKYQAMKKGIV